MKHLITFIFIALISVSGLYAQKFKGLDKSPLDLIEYPGGRGEAQWVRVLYSRPQLNGRAIESLVPDGKIWRMGANEATELTLYESLKVGNTSLEAGVYTLYAIPSESQMTIVINRATHVWGTDSYNEALDVARVSVPLTEGDQSLEAFSMIFEKEGEQGVTLHMGWDYYRAALTFTK